MKPADTVVRLLEECRDDDERQVFTLAFVNGELRVTPRSDPAAYPAIITRDQAGYTIAYGTESRAAKSGHPTPGQAAAKIHQIFGIAFPVHA